MNFVDTAITLLHESGRPMGVQELCDLALDRGLLDKPGANPLRSMKTRLTVELKKGKKSRVLQDGDEGWKLGKGVKLPSGAPTQPAKKVAKEKSAAKTKVAAKAKPAAKAKTATRAATKAKPAKKVAKPSAAKVAAKGEDAAAAPKKTRRTRKSVAAEKKSEDTTDVKAKSEVTAPIEVVEIEPPVKLSPEEEALVELYASDSQGTRSAAELNEYRDGLTKDEDRPMLPEIRAERRPHRGRERTRKRRSRSDRDERPERSERSSRARSARGERSEAPAAKRPRTGPRDIAGAPIAVVQAESNPREQLTAAAYAVLAGLPAGQSMPVRQLTQALIRQEHLEGSADALWRMVKGALLVSEQRRTARGLPPLVRYRGKDLFSVGTVGGRSSVELAKTALARAAENYAAAVESEMQARLAQLAPQMLERIGYVYLQATGWTDISWIKRVEKSSYALATAPGAVEQTMVAVRSGPEDIDRRGVGELRAGLHAKDLDAGFLISPCLLSEEADVELAKEGVHVRVLCGQDFVGDLVSREVGITWHHQQLPSVDQRFWDALLS
ncbi:MAG: hypothetical protein GY811_16295 [Myxococcales bacterium]|nr:hypothetical protein [Myxococcales bacterium]